MAVLVEGGLAVVALLLAWWFDVPLRQEFPTTDATLAWAVSRGLVATLPMLALFWWLIRSPRPAWQRLRQQVEWLVGELFPSGNLAQLALIALLAGVGEELLFRGVIQTKLSGWTTPLAGLALASLLFGTAHALSRLYFLLATLIGFYLGWLAMQPTDYDLVAPMTAHAVYDFVALVYLSRAGRRHARQAPVAPEADDEPADH